MYLDVRHNVVEHTAEQHACKGLLEEYPLCLKKNIILEF
jgi:hypothetical protein